MENASKSNQTKENENQYSYYELNCFNFNRNEGLARTSPYFKG